MALSYAVRRQLLAASLPESTEVRLELQDYLARTGMTPPDFARRINYARETVYSFLNGNYSRSQLRQAL
jgi:predicted transcriptional regulator